MSVQKILILAGSTREGSFNGQLAAAAAQMIEGQDGKVTLVNLADYPMELVDFGNSSGEMPKAVQDLHALFGSHHGIFLATPEYNAFPSPLLLNMIDWLSRVRHYEGGMAEVFERPLYAIAAASPSPIGGYRALMALRQKLELGVGATVIPAMAHIAAAYQAFDGDGNLASENDQGMLGKVVTQLLGRLQR